MYRTRKTQRENRKQAQWKREQDMVEGDSQYGSRERETLGEKTERERESWRSPQRGREAAWKKQPERKNIQLPVTHNDDSTTWLHSSGNLKDHRKTSQTLRFFPLPLNQFSILESDIMWKYSAGRRKVWEERGLWCFLEDVHGAADVFHWRFMWVKGWGGVGIYGIFKISWGLTLFACEEKRILQRRQNFNGRMEWLCVRGKLEAHGHTLVRTHPARHPSLSAADCLAGTRMSWDQEARIPTHAHRAIASVDPPSKPAPVSTRVSIHQTSFTLGYSFL